MLGVLIFAPGGEGDLIWHELFGIEMGSPISHIYLPVIAGQSKIALNTYLFVDIELKGGCLGCLGISRPRVGERRSAHRSKVLIHFLPYLLSTMGAIRCG
jgi:hypothetical protein